MLLCPWDSPGKILEWVTMPSSRGSSQSRKSKDKYHIKGEERESIQVTSELSILTLYHNLGNKRATKNHELFLLGLSS